MHVGGGGVVVVARRGRTSRRRRSPDETRRDMSDPPGRFGPRGTVTTPRRALHGNATQEKRFAPRYGDDAARPSDATMGAQLLLLRCYSSTRATRSEAHKPTNQPGWAYCDSASIHRDPSLSLSHLHWARPALPPVPRAAPLLRPRPRPPLAVQKPQSPRDQGGYLLLLPPPPPLVPPPPPAAKACDHPQPQPQPHAAPAPTATSRIRPRRPSPARSTCGNSVVVGGAAAVTGRGAVRSMEIWRWS